MVVPNNHGFFLLKIIILGCFWGYHHLRKHPPYNHCWRSNQKQDRERYIISQSFSVSLSLTHVYRYMSTRYIYIYIYIFISIQYTCGTWVELGAKPGKSPSLKMVFQVWWWHTFPQSQWTRTCFFYRFSRPNSGCFGSKKAIVSFLTDRYMVDVRMIGWRTKHHVVGGSFFFFPRDDFCCKVTCFGTESCEHQPTVDILLEVSDWKQNTP